MKQESLASLMSSAVHKPASVGCPGAALALACHAIMIRSGFNVVDEGQGTFSRRSSYQPNADWQSNGPSEWQFHYNKDGKANKFTMIVSLHNKSGRVLVHVSEENNASNAQVLGLQLGNYITVDAQQLKNSRDWEAVVSSETVLVDYMQQYICFPLLQQAEELSPRMQYQKQLSGASKGLFSSPFASDRGSSEWGGSLQHVRHLYWTATTAGMLAMAAAATATAVYAFRSIKK
mmetsp:Transcript_13595/g.29099  ORF Transcript_13595/g.29099 Transcript_13595/m.29099 type:complete len:233 (+) Transcript_13595:252-950(+)|eukprot:CAMPEP_0202895236 /NCGR_PEP_ID=MMETSP1392-20130828/4475_1 /ASSEMBLY_ACC=CAM_ASM_000868 /TAXON_ID=225041 /ORGANISM="Chlamydomonas chlamydogama, Strain SAG 11-48b" /LENGTH=232 /DNA_ID=CAMNT_0049580175 /DNA_START=252 /DNA_END=950 /DNA_ORIENTATION=-